MRLAGLEPLAPPQLIDEAARYAIEAFGRVAQALRHADADALLQSIDDCAEGFAVQLMRAHLAGRREPRRRAGLEVGYQELMATARLRDIARGNVVALRQLVFGSEKVPFATLPEATAWIGQEEKRAGTYSREESRELRAAYAKIGIELLKLQLRGPGFRYDYSFPTPRSFVTRRGAGLRSWEVGKSEPLLQLQQGLEALVRDLFVEDWQAADFVLLDVPPAVPRYSISRHDRPVLDLDVWPREIVHARWIELHIHDRFFSYEDTRAAFRDLAASGFLLSRKSPVQLAKLERLQRFVDERRPPQGWRGGALRKALPWRQVWRNGTRPTPRRTTL